ncbi:universal stress protein [Tengunoibacter tsumagoiensis]|uniref:Universal stress protein UspA n=1 Tax=Tengunoibacter tsumagoiensis TaxID=2014871 RepID=A0A401ZXM9_9CHLR|nr:universal stress protein [Tengunoibacter tsumagoiensis]GCE11618.1 universal stress protein UspA [Tengunoibacter tsumagoiensis]
MKEQTNMMQFQKILVPLDGSSLAEEAIPLAVHIARACNAEVYLLRVVPPSSCVPLYPYAPLELAEPMREAAFTKARDYLKQVVTSAHLDALKVHIDVQMGGSAATIIDTARVYGIDLIVMRSHGETGFTRWVMGSTAQQLVRYCPVPVLVIRGTQSQLLPLVHAPRILVALDGSSLSEEAIRPAAQLSAALAQVGQGSIHLTRVVERLITHRQKEKDIVEQQNKACRAEAEAYLHQIKERFSSGELASFGLTVTGSVVTYSDIEDITRRIIEESSCIGDEPGFTGCDIIAMTTHGRHGFQHFLFSSFTEAVFDAAPQPILVVHAAKTDHGSQSSKQKETNKQKKADVVVF